MKFEKARYWLDLNIHIKEAIGFSAFALAVSALINDFPFQWMKELGVAVILLLGILVIFQLILGLWKIAIDVQEYKKDRDKELSKKEDQENVLQAKVGTPYGSS